MISHQPRRATARILGVPYASVPIKAWRAGQWVSYRAFDVWTPCRWTRAGMQFARDDAGFGPFDGRYFVGKAESDDMCERMNAQA